MMQSIQPIGCLCGCGRIAFRRGLSHNCWRWLRKRIQRGETTEAAEVTAGRMFPRHDKASGHLKPRRIL